MTSDFLAQYSKKLDQPLSELREELIGKYMDEESTDILIDALKQLAVPSNFAEQMTKAIEEGVKIGERKMLAQVIKEVDEMLKANTDLINKDLMLFPVGTQLPFINGVKLKQKLASYAEKLT